PPHGRTERQDEGGPSGRSAGWRGGIPAWPAGGRLLACLLLAGCDGADGQGGARSDSASPAPFTDVTAEVGLAFVHDAGVDSSYYMPESIGSGGAFLDYDGDGDLDIYLVNGARRGVAGRSRPPLRNRLFRQEADGSFTDVTEASGLGDPGYGMGVAVGDIDNDGDPDVYVTNVGPDALYRNEGDGTFAEISRAAGIGNPAWGASAVFFDYDSDGLLDLYVTNYVAFDSTVVCTDEAGRPDYCGPAAFPGVPDVLYHNEGNGTFADVSVASGIAAGRSKGLGVVAADFDRDGRQDLYVANDGEANHLWLNEGDGTFRDEAGALGAAVNALGRPEAGMGIALGDIDEDADLDLLITHLGGETNTLYRRAGPYGYQDDTSLAGLHGPSLPYTGFGTGFVDYDQDGDLDLVVVNGRVIRGPPLTTGRPPDWWDPYAEPNQLFENDGAGRFREVSEGVPALFEAVENSRGLAFGDVDEDGDLDLLITNGGGPARLLRSDGAKGHWLIVRAVEPALRRDAIGAEVTVVAGGRRLHRIATAGESFLSSSDPRVHFGLGDAAEVERILVRWPDGTSEAFPGVAADRAVTLRRGEGAPADG
ncbi:MAG: CRTAC1 family protein, partial [Gemmatimonadota bacterium]